MLNNTVRQMLLGIICLWIITLPNCSGDRSDKIYEKNNKALVVILSYDKKDKLIGLGSGFIVRSDGVIVTNLHVVSKAVSIKVKIAKDRYLEVEGVLYSDEANDLVILKTKGEDLSVLKLGDSDKIKPGEKVYVIDGHGIISGVRDISNNQKIIQITAPVSQGSSGGPVFNEKGEVIGIATGILKDAQNLNFAMPVNLIRDKINNREILPLEETIAHDYMGTTGYWFLQGDYLYKAGKYKEAIESYKKAIRIMPDLAEVHLNLGLACGRLSDWRKGIESFKQAIRIKPDFAEAHYNVGVAYGELGNYAKEIDSYKQAIRVRPDYTEAHLNIGVVYLKLKDDKKAIESFKQAIRIKPDYADAHLNLGLACLIVGDRSSALEEHKILKDLDKELASDLFNLIQGE